jgi:hypothetical protein
MLRFVVAEKLGMTLADLTERMTPEELYLWSLFYDIRNEEEQAAYEKAKKRRR